jgi:hypothetical protein
LVSGLLQKGQCISISNIGYQMVRYKGIIATLIFSVTGITRH